MTAFSSSALLIAFAAVFCVAQRDCCDVSAPLVNCDACSPNTTVIFLSELGLTSDRLSPGLFAHLPNLLELHLEKNVLFSLPPGLFDGCRALSEIWLDNNGLRAAGLPANIFSDTTNLTGVVFRNNFIEALPEGLFGPQHEYLIKLYFDNNRLTSSGLLSASLFSLPRLQTLSLSFNLIDTISEGMFPPSLTSVNLKNNIISYVDTNSFRGFSHLFNIILENNIISSLPSGIFDDVASLGILYLTNNTLTSEGLPGNIFAKSSKLQSLYLNKNNGIEWLHVGVVSPVRNPIVKLVNLDANTKMPQVCQAVFKSIAAIPASCFSAAGEASDNGSLLLHA